MGLLKDAIRGGKDTAISVAIKMHAERYLCRYGDIKHLAVDSSNRSIEVEILLKGETGSIILKTARYEIISGEGRSLIVPQEVSASREWIDVLAKEHIENRPIPIPDSLAKVLTFCA